MVGVTRLWVNRIMLSGGAVIVFSFAPVFWIAVPVIAVASYSITITGISCQSLVQNSVKGELRGRVISIYAVIFRAAPAVGALALGALSEVFGWHWPMATSAAPCLFVSLWRRKRQSAMCASLAV